MHKESTPITEEQKQSLHKRKIDLSDMIYVLNINNYIRESIKSETQYTYNTSKPIHFAEPTNYDFSKT